MWSTKVKSLLFWKGMKWRKERSSQRIDTVELLPSDKMTDRWLLGADCITLTLIHTWSTCLCSLFYIYSRYGDYTQLYKYYSLILYKGTYTLQHEGLCEIDCGEWWNQACYWLLNSYLWFTAFDSIWPKTLHFKSRVTASLDICLELIHCELRKRNQTEDQSDDDTEAYLNPLSCIDID